jgi:aspartyl-tRNA(Asn)/glutamyl-tRNA(Gln) amidotransferase subunit C
MTRTLNDILVYMEKLGELETETTEPMTHAIPKVNVIRDDAVSPSDAKEEILKNAPEKQVNFIKVPKVIE